MKAQLTPEEDFAIVVSRALLHLLATDDPDAALEQAIDRVGRAASMSRITVLTAELDASDRWPCRPMLQWEASRFPKNGGAGTARPDVRFAPPPRGIEEDGWWHEPNWDMRGQICGKEDPAVVGIVPVRDGTGRGAFFVFESQSLSRTVDRAQRELLKMAAHGMGNAIARRQREKAAHEHRIELAKGNEALRRSISAMAKAENLRGALVEAVRAAAEVVGAGGGGLGVFLPEERGFRDLFHVVNGELREVEGDTYVSRLFSLDEEPVRLAWEQFQGANTVLWCPLDSPYLASDARELLASFDLPSFVLVGIKRGAECIGYIGFSTQLEADVPPAKRELLKAIADQISLMLEVSRLAQASETIAVTREREIAAVQRAAEVTRFNDAMKRTGIRLVSAADTDEILPLILSEACRALGASAGILFGYDPEKNALALLHAVYGPSLQQATYGHQAGPLHYSPISSFQPWRRLIEDDQPVYDQSPELIEPWPHNGGHRGVLRRALLIDQEPYGLLSMAFAESRSFSAAEYEACNAFAQQATLALQMSKLAAAAKNHAAETATLEERNRIAREIHDTLAQNFTGILIKLRALSHCLESPGGDDFVHHLHNAIDIAQDGLREARRSVSSLRPAELETGSFLGAIRLIAQLMEQQSDIRIDVQCEEVDEVFRPQHHGELVRIIREAVMNVIKHARARNVQIGYSLTGGRKTLSVLDDGVGFDTAEKTEGFGLIGMRERAARIGADLAIQSGPAGTAIHVSVPGES